MQTEAAFYAPAMNKLKRKFKNNFTCHYIINILNSAFSHNEFHYCNEITLHTHKNGCNTKENNRCG